VCVCVCVCRKPINHGSDLHNIGYIVIVTVINLWFFWLLQS
jgi:hypothetical protein